MKNTKKLFLTIVSACMLLVTIIGSTNNDSLFAQIPDIESSFEEKLNEDKTESTISLNLKYDTTKYQVDKIIQPDKSEILPKESEPLTTLSYSVKENGKFNFEVTYTELETKDVKTVIFTYEVKDIQIPEVKKEEQPKEDGKAPISKNDKTTKATDKRLANGTTFLAEGAQFTVVDEDTNSVAMIGLDMDNLSESLASGFSMFYPNDLPTIPGLPDFPALLEYRGVVVKPTVDFDGITYNVTDLSIDGKTFGSNKGTLAMGKLTLTGSNIKKISKSALRVGVDRYYFPSLTIPDTVETIDDNNFQAMARLLELKLSPNTTTYGNNVIMGLSNFKGEIIVPEGTKPVTAGMNFISQSAFTRVVLPSNMKAIGNSSLGILKKLEKLEIWNTTQMGTTYNFAGNNLDAYYLVKSHTKFDKTTDSVYNTFANNGVNADHIVYGMIDDISTTSDTTQTVKPNNTTTFDIDISKSIKNDTVDKTADFTTDWIDGSITYTIVGNTSVNTKVVNNTLTIGSNETADTITVKAASTFDPSKFVEFTINVDQTAPVLPVAQIIKDSTYNEVDGTYSGGTYVNSYVTLQDAIAALNGNGSEVIELLVDYEIPKSDVVILNDKKVAFTTAPKTNHTASSNSGGDTPKLFTGSGNEAVIKRASDNDNNLLSITGTAEITISRLTLDGANIKTGKNTLRVSDKAVVNLKTATTVQNGKIVNYSSVTGNDDGRGTIYVKGGTLNIFDGVVIKNNIANMGGGIYIIGGTTNIYGGDINNNTATIEDRESRLNPLHTGSGGGIFLKSGVLNLSGGVIQQNNADTTGGGIEMNSQVSDSYFISSYLYVSGNPKVINNKNNGVNQNMYLAKGHYVSVSGELVDDAEIGITADGNDIKKRNRMLESSIFGNIKIMNDAVSSSPKSLEHFVNDIDSNLYGYNGGYFGMKHSVIWKPKTSTTDFILKIGNQGYYSFPEAFTDIVRNTNDSQTPATSNAIPEGKVYKIEMLVEDYAVPSNLLIPASKQLIITTAKENPSGTPGRLDYRGTAGSYASLNRSNDIVGVSGVMIVLADNSSALTLKNISIDGQGGVTWKDINGNEITGKGNTIATEYLINVMSGSVTLDTGTNIKNSNYLTTLVMVSPSFADSFAKATIKDGVIIQGNLRNNGTGGNGGIFYSASSYFNSSSIINIEGGLIIGNENRDSQIPVLNVSGDNALIEMSGGTITKNVMEIVSADMDGTFNLSGGKITNNVANLFGTVSLFGGYFNMTGGEITGNKILDADIFGSGGGVFTMDYADSSINISGGKISGNTAPNSGGGIYAGVGNSLTISGSSQIFGNASGSTATANANGEAILGANGVTDNVHLVPDAYVNVDAKFTDTAKVGITAEGNDVDAKNRMSQGAQFGINAKNDQDVLDSLNKLFRDTNGTATDGMKLYGKDGGLYAPADPDAGTPETYKVVWEANVYEVTFNAMGGTLNSIEKVELNDGDIITKPTDPTYAGHAFEGWYTDDQFTTEWDFSTPVTSDMTLYAKWNPVVYRVSFNANTGTGNMADMNYSVGDTITLTTNAFTKTGFEFAGWNTSVDGTGTAYADKASIPNMSAASMTLYAQWKASGPSVFVDIPKSIILSDGDDGYAKQSGEVKIVKNSVDEAFYPNDDILIRTVTSLTLTNNISADTFLVSVFKSDASQYLDSTSPLMTLNVKDAKKQEDTFTLKTKIDRSKSRNLYNGFMNFVIEFRP